MVTGLLRSLASVVALPRAKYRGAWASVLDEKGQVYTERVFTACLRGYSADIDVGGALPKPDPTTCLHIDPVKVEEQGGMYLRKDKWRYLHIQLTEYRRQSGSGTDCMTVCSESQGTKSGVWGGEGGGGTAQVEELLECEYDLEVDAHEHSPAPCCVIVTAHRILAWAMHGPCGHTASMVMHLCDNPLCLNPWHLKWGSMQENHRDNAH
jgi:hypothetical protein